jgi:hypothetical protein
MDTHDLVDELYEAFADRIGDPLSESARDLPRALRLAPEPVPWSQVFSHAVTLGAPALFAEAMPNVERAHVRDAVLAHLLAVIDAFGTDRLEDEQIEASPVVFAVLGQARRERDRALARVVGKGAKGADDFRAADVATIQAIRRERAALLSGRPVDMKSYEEAALAKQGVGIIASVSLARAARWNEKRCRAVQATLESVSLGLQMYDDVVDWEDDLQRGGAWAVCLMRGMDASPFPNNRAALGTPIRLQVLQSGVLKTMLARARDHMKAARRRAQALGALELASWAAGQESRLRNLETNEASHAGYAVRASALAAWAREVLA